MIKRISLLTRRDEWSEEDFRRHWLEVHGPLAQKVPGMRRYVQNHIVDRSGHPLLPSSGGRVDGVAELWFDDREAMEKALSSPEAKAMFEDGAKMLGAVTTYLVEEKVLVGE